MEQEVKTKENGGVTTRAEKKDAAKGIIRELLQQKSFKAGELIDEAAKLYTQRFKGEDTENVNDVKGRVGSVLDVMKKEEEVSFDGGMYALKVAPVADDGEKKAEEKPKKAARKTTKKTVKEAEEKTVDEVKSDEGKEKKAETTPAPVAAEEKTEKPAAKKRTGRKKAAAEEAEKPTEKKEPVKTEEAKAEEKLGAEEKKEEKKPAAKKRATKKKAEAVEVKTEEKTPEATETAEVKTEKESIAPVAAVAEAKPLVEEAKAEASKEEKKEEKPAESVPHAVMDMSFLFGDIKGAKKAEKPTEKKEPVKTEEPKAEKREEQPATKREEKTNGVKKEEKGAEKAAENPVSAPVPAPVLAATVPTVKPAQNGNNGKKQQTKRVEQPKKSARAMTADEKLKEAFLKKLHKLGGEYFEYYSVYLLEKYSRMNGRRLEGLKISAGDRDGGIDGEIELTDRLGFRETIYIQAKNWDPDKGDEKLWVVGETLLQQFIGACVCRQAKEGKQHCRGIFITTSRFTPEAKHILDDTSDKFVGYDGEDLYETAKECGFGIVKKNGEYVLDEALLSGEKAFFNMI